FFARVGLAARALRFAHFAHEFVQLIEARGIFAETARLFHRQPARIRAGLVNAARHEGATCQHDIVADREVTGDTDLSADHDALADRRASGNAGTPGDHCMG